MPDEPTITPERIGERLPEPRAADSFTTPGTFNWTAPAGVFTVQVECWGGGGGSGSDSVGFAGGGGGGGGYSRKNSHPTSPGTNYAYKVGAGGNSAQAGQSSTFLTTIVVANGGNAGTDSTGGGFGTGGSGAAVGTGDVRFSGGGGGSGEGTTGGGGGGSGGINANGNGGNDGFSNGLGGSAVAGGGSGGSAGSGVGSGGSVGNPPGGGAGGSGQNASGNRGGNGKVTFTYTVAPVAATPTFAPGAGAYTGSTTVAISCSTGGVTIRYTTDGSTPSSSFGTIGTSVVLTANCTLRAIAYNTGVNQDSAVASAAYQIVCVAPTFAPGGGTYTSGQSVAISSVTPGCTFRWTTDGSTPTSSSGNVGSVASVPASCTLRAIAYKAGNNDSAVSAAAYTIYTNCATPTFAPGAGTYTSGQSVTISSATPGCTFRYTTDGSTPSSSVGTIGSVASVPASCTLRAVAYQAGYNDSAVGAAAYTIYTNCAAPIFNPGTGIFPNPPTVTITSTTPGCTFRYTTDGSTPTSSYGTVGNSVVISVSCTLKAIAYQAGYNDSTVTSSAFTIWTTCAAPTFAPGAGSYWGTQTVSISSVTPGCTIRWTTNGTDPTSNTGNVGNSVVIPSPCVLKAIAYQAGYNDSTVTSGTYTILRGRSQGSITG